MCRAEQNKTEAASWINKLVAEIEKMTFAAEDGELYVSFHQDLIVSEQQSPFTKVEELAEEQEFTEELNRLIKTKWTGTKRALCEKAFLLENTFYKIQAGRRLPGRNTVICLALALGLKVKKTRHLLGYLGYGLCEHIKRDYIILRCLELGRTPLEVNLVLDKCGLSLLGPDE